MEGSNGIGDKQRRVVPKIVGSIPPCARNLLYFHAVYRGKIPEVFQGKACIYPALVREIFSRTEPLSSCVIMCMYRNFTIRLVTVYTPYSLTAEQN
jgi:hypothetical protein